MKKWLTVIWLVFALFFVGGMTETVFSMNMEQITALNSTSNQTDYVGKDVFYNIGVATETNICSFSYLSLHTSRTKRSISLQIACFFRNLSRRISQLDSDLVRHNRHLYGPIKHFISEPLCKYYYVFALRRIII